MAKKKIDNRTNILFRYGLIVIAILGLSASIVAKLVENTVVDADKWNERVEKEMNFSKAIEPHRGNILAADGSILATDLNFYTARIDYRAERFSEKLLRDSIGVLSEAMATYFPEKSAQEWKEHILKPLSVTDKNKRTRNHRLISGLSHSDMELLKSLPYFNRGNGNRTGLTFEKYMRRFNPYGNMAKRSIGRVGQTKESPEIHGRSGIEMALDSLLYGVKGSTGKVHLTKDIKDMAAVEAVPGCDVVTTIDIAMQDILESELNNVLDSCGAEWGVAVLMEVKTGDIKAISNLEMNPDGPGYIEAMNRAVQRYEPGSVVKTLSMMIALEDSIVTDMDEMLPTGAGWSYSKGRTITDAHHSTAIRVGDVLEQSSNIGMARIITRKYDSNPGGFYSRIKQTGFLEPLNTGIAGERTPRIDSVKNNNEGRIAMSRQSYGYATEIPPIYTLALYNAIANDGVFVKPRIVKELRGSVDSVLPVGYIGNGRACSPSTASKIKEMLTRVVWGEHGTGKFLRNNLVKIAGKTGTCYMVDYETGQYDTSRKRLAFCGFFPADNPIYSCVVLTCHPTKNFFGAATTSGQVLKNTAMKLYSRGLLGNKSEYATDTPSDAGPTFYASTDRNSFGMLRKPFGLAKGKSLAKPDRTQSGIPDVRRLSARDAIATLEAAGYEVAVTGAGFVHTQTPAPGTLVIKGSRVYLGLAR
ncbi:MAG: transpeptidase family protein [Muribaculaceae bacterium]|nr:transpeptidase family protein [Muribaculaceae bacterium]